MSQIKKTLLIVRENSYKPATLIWDFSKICDRDPKLKLYISCLSIVKKYLYLFA